MNQTNMKTKFYFPLFLFSIQFGFAQTFVGYEIDNFNGIHGVMVNPGNIVQQKNKAELNLISYGSSVGTDLAEVDITDIFNVFTGDFDLVKLNNGLSDNNNAFANEEIIGPSFVADINDKYSFSVFTKLRKISNYTNVNGNLFVGIANGFPEEDFNIDQNNFDATSHTWGELGVSLGREILNAYVNSNEIHFAKAGVSVKWLRGMGVELDSSATIIGGYSAAANQLNLNGDFSHLNNGTLNPGLSDLLEKTGQGIGVDIGVVYERRTRSSTDPDVEDDYRALNQYRYKIGLSVLDIGRISYGTANLQNYNLNGIVNTTGFQNTSNVTQVLEDNNFSPRSSPGKLKMGLPTRLRAEVDFKFMPNWYVNLVGNYSLVDKDNLYNNNMLNTGIFTLRYETRKISGYLPVTVGKFGRVNVSEVGFDVGLGVNILGFLHVGSGNLLSELIPSKNPSISAANLFVGVKVPFSWELWGNWKRKR